MTPFRPTSTDPKGPSVCDFGRAREGGAAVTVAESSAVLVGVLGIAIDLGRSYNLSAELDNAADAFALAGVARLDQSPGSSLANTEAFASNAATASRRQPGEAYSVSCL